MRDWVVAIGVFVGPGLACAAAVEQTVEVVTVAVAADAKARTAATATARTELRARAATESRATLHPDGRVTIACGQVRDLRLRNPPAAKVDRP